MTIGKMGNRAPPSMKAISKRLKQEQDIKAARNKLALTSIKDTLSILNPLAGSNDDEEFDLTDFDPKSFYANRRSFEELPFYKRTLVVEDNKERMKKNWKNLNMDVKRFSFWWAYGSHGPREGFPENYDWFTTPHEVKEDVKPLKVKDESRKTNSEFDQLINSITPESTSVQMASRAALQSDTNALESSKLNVKSDVPLDLPFKHPSVLRSPPFSKWEGKVNKLAMLDPRSFGVKRVQQYRQDRMMNPIAKIALVCCIFLTVLCFKKDRRVNVSGEAPVYPWDEVEEEVEPVEEVVVETPPPPPQGKRWYYLWLK